MIDDVSPVKGATNKYLSCGQNAQKASTVATASPGSKVSFKWSAITGGNVSFSSQPPASNRWLTARFPCSGSTTSARS